MKTTSRERDIVLRITVPSFGTDEQAAQSASRIREMLRISVNSRIEVEMKGRKGWEPVGDVTYERIV